MMMMMMMHEDEEGDDGDGDGDFWETWWSQIGWTNHSHNHDGEIGSFQRHGFRRFHVDLLCALPKPTRPWNPYAKRSFLGTDTLPKRWTFHFYNFKPTSRWWVYWFHPKDSKWFHPKHDQGGSIGLWSQRGRAGGKMDVNIHKQGAHYKNSL